ncbi:ThiJ/PfpI family protein [Cutibacterium acnes JCM 18909]|nr:ThiJ/PfpI family protein [Cutibacterium acnes JCM 18909]
MTSYISIRPDLENAGASWVDKKLFRCPGNGWVLLTSRNPNDLPAFTKGLVDEIS